jgi:lipid-A-disaccharide synthase
MKKIFMVAGELSGDLLGAWYLRLLRKSNSELSCDAVGGNTIKNAGAHLYAPITDLNVVGIIEIIRHLPFLFRFMSKLADHIVEQGFREVILIDFPGFNMRLARALKKRKPDIFITYLSPPQLWAWGSWRIKKLKKYVDQVVVLYPFEVEWYRQRGIDVMWLGSPHYERLQPYFDYTHTKEEKIAFLPATRTSELRSLLPVMIPVLKRFKLAYPGAKIILPLAESISRITMEKALRAYGFQRWGNDVCIVQGQEEKLKELSTCCLAITKPGTITLELALLKVPSVVVFKTSWLTYLLARPLVRVTSMSLPNLLLKKPVFEEFIQSDCRSQGILGAIKDVYCSFTNGAVSYQRRLNQLEDVRHVLGQKLQK